MKLHGFGDAKVEGKSIGRITYDLNVEPPTEGDMGCASGALFGDSEALRDAFEAGHDVKIRRENTGEAISCFIMSLENGVFSAVVDGNPGQLN